MMSSNAQATKTENLPYALNAFESLIKSKLKVKKPRAHIEEFEFIPSENYRRNDLKLIAGRIQGIVDFASNTSNPKTGIYQYTKITHFKSKEELTEFIKDVQSQNKKIDRESFTKIFNKFKASFILPSMVWLTLAIGNIKDIPTSFIVGVGIFMHILSKHDFFLRWFLNKDRALKRNLGRIDRYIEEGPENSLALFSRNYRIDTTIANEFTKQDLNQDSLFYNSYKQALFDNTPLLEIPLRESLFDFQWVGLDIVIEKTDRSNVEGFLVLRTSMSPPLFPAVKEKDTKQDKKAQEALLGDLPVSTN